MNIPVDEGCEGQIGSLLPMLFGPNGCKGFSVTEPNVLLGIGLNSEVIDRSFTVWQKEEIFIYVMFSLMIL